MNLSFEDLPHHRMRFKFAKASVMSCHQHYFSATLRWAQYHWRNGEHSAVDCYTNPVHHDSAALLGRQVCLGRSLLANEITAFRQWWAWCAM